MACTCPTTRINSVSLENKKKKGKKDGRTHLLELSIPLTSLKQALNTRLHSRVYRGDVGRGGRGRGAGRNVRVDGAGYR
jgi:hypothetical protein